MASSGRKLAPNATPMATARIMAKARYWPATTRLAEPCSPAPWAKNNDKTTMSSKLVTANNPAASAMRPELMGGRASGPVEGPQQWSCHVRLAVRTVKVKPHARTPMSWDGGCPLLGEQLRDALGRRAEAARA